MSKSKAKCLRTAFLLFAGLTSTFTTVAVRVDAAPTSEVLGSKKFDEGKRAFERKKYEQALAAFLASVDVLPSPNTRLYIARCYRELDKPGKAYVEFQRTMREAEDRRRATGESRYSATRDAAAQEAAQLDPKVPRITLAVPADAPVSMRILLDKEELPRSGWGTPVETDPGKHEVTVSGGRVRPESQSFDIKLGEKRRIELRIERLPTSVLRLKLKSKPGGLAAEIDEIPIEPTQVEAPLEVDPGEHTIVVRAPGYVPFVWKKVTADGQTLLVPVDFSTARGTPKWAFFSSGALSLGLLGVGSALAVSATLTAGAENGKNPLLRDPVVRDRIRADSLAANALFVAGAAAALGTGVLFFTTDWKRPQPDAGQSGGFGVAPWIGSHEGGVVARGRF